MKRFFLLLSLLVFFHSAVAQNGEGGLPYIFNQNVLDNGDVFYLFHTKDSLIKSENNQYVGIGFYAMGNEFSMLYLGVTSLDSDLKSICNVVSSEENYCTNLDLLFDDGEWLHGGLVQLSNGKGYSDYPEIRNVRLFFDPRLIYNEQETFVSLSYVLNKISSHDIVRIVFDGYTVSLSGSNTAATYRSMLHDLSLKEGYAWLRQSVGSAPAATRHSANYTTKSTYKVGDYYHVGDVEGVVFAVDSTGKHGKVVELHQAPACFPWCTDSWTTGTNRVVLTIGAGNTTDGEANLRVVQSQYDWEHRFPAFAFCVSKGSGWYLPAIKELRAIVNNRGVLNRTLESVGGDPILPNKHNGTEPWGWYWSSTESGEPDDDYGRCAWREGWDFPDGPFAGVRTQTKDSDHTVRAVHKF